jgi:integrase
VVKTALRATSATATRISDVRFAPESGQCRTIKRDPQHSLPFCNDRALPTHGNAPTALSQQKRTSAELVFPMSGNSARLAFERLRARANMSDFHFHDLRHEAITRFSERGLSIAEVSAISGHKELRML